MPLLTIESFSQLHFEKKGRFLGFDLGEKTIGLALSDIGRSVATPFKVMLGI